MIQVINESDKVKCPICGREFAYLNNFHLKTHGYSSEKEFLKDFPEFVLKGDSVKKNIQNHLNTLNSDSEVQSAKAKNGWTDARRKQKSDLMKNVSRDLHTLPKYADARNKIYKNRHGIRKKYKTRDGEVLFLRSKLEWDIAYFLDSNQIDYEYEKIQIPYKKDGSIHQYLPDFFVKSCNLIIEGKYSNETDNFVVQLKKNACEEAGYNFLFVDEKLIKDTEKLLAIITALHVK